ncbi:hypothetical protein WKH31_01205 [Metabacillus indicus]|uniref:hypothetical protein n=1 Tax=Metabacillus indicus TaxID=246786 RepID=UPI00318033D1
MDSELMSNFIRIGLPLLVMAVSVFLTLKLPYSRRFIPPVTLAILAALVYVIPTFLQGNDKDLNDVLLTLYFTMTLMLSCMLSLIAALFFKKKKK